MRDLAIELKRIGHEVDVVLVNRPVGDSWESEARSALDAEGIPVFFLNRRRGYPGLRAASRLSHLCRQRQYDVVHSHLTLANSIVGLARCFTPRKYTHVSTIHNTRENWGWLVSLLARHATKVACSKAVARHRGVSVVIPNGIDLVKFRPFIGTCAVTHEAIGLPPHCVMLLAVGSLKAQRNYGCLLRTVAILNQRTQGCAFHCVICGEGKERIALSQLAATLSIGDKVHLLGSRTDIPRLLASADLFISTSLHEGLPLTVLEAMASGIPCVLSPIEEHRDIATGMHECFFALSNTPEEMVKAVQRALRSPMPKAQVAGQREPLLQPYSIRRCAQSYLDLYRSLNP